MLCAYSIYLFIYYLFILTNNPESRSKWKRLFDSELERNGGEAILKGNLNKKDVNNLKISEPFVKEILVIWSEVFFSRKR